MLDGLLDTMEDERISQAVEELAGIFKRRIVEGEKALAWSKNEDSGRYDPSEYRTCLTVLVRLTEVMNEALVSLDTGEIDDLDEFTDKLDEEVEAMKKRIQEKLAAREAKKAANIEKAVAAYKGQGI